MVIVSVKRTRYSHGILSSINYDTCNSQLAISGEIVIVALVMLWLRDFKDLISLGVKLFLIMISPLLFRIVEGMMSKGDMKCEGGRIEFLVNYSAIRRYQNII